VKPRLIIALLMTGVLVISAAAEGNSTALTRSSVTARSARQQPSSTTIRPTQTQVPPGSHDANADPQSSSDNGQTIVVDVWSSATEADSARLSPGFALAALNAASRLQFTERRIAHSIKTGYLLGEFWIQTDFDAIEDSLGPAALSATTEADRQTLQQLQTQTQRLRLWSDWVIEQKKQMRLADYYTSSAPLDNDERFQGTVACTNFLLSMLASGRLQEEDRSCR
jgi:hypothetical protein